MTAPSLPSEKGAEVGRRIGVGLMYGLFKPRVLGSWKVPASGPVIFAVNHSHNIDGPMVMGVAPRPTHFLIKKEAFIGPLDPFLLGIGQVKVDRSGADRGAITQALDVLSAGGVLGIFPEGTRGEGDFAALRAGLAYFAVRSGAPIVPVAVLGSSERPGRLIKALPPLRTRIDVVFGDPFEAGDGSGRRTRKVLDEATERIQKQLTSHLENARRLTGR
ncbi:MULTISPECIES: lysophospholipid acyltransferase family protein [unclassified Streptomyces]|uniref:lysophospholipid acyltransferase family protein n=1 Tax=unclassified Streptomyces TaxID=2593676 RepID=UPI002255904E|nr:MULTISPECIES: lysophospholipid acyltransferase family protein [unclassified Streptomyces]MCX4879781.1 1-acyl-sn-glycerol-3-phosphate acyltransferase [Streptomyces sp. NBC_00847]MCX5047131.1 1-acyl-sn-glycerol-3-phosphate acyltransferase [Streptomyces sp. NBC_00474]MCX5244952.1 1-acyl-sn-glycerol-3-phosphate acyltransferase [Streptomyces sp. NBC_00201]MCX5289316.1 1-acyl-sn-glycerol-3-phosphate acyltransferase [Streptomyces sp. NBC_00183]